MCKWCCCSELHPFYDHKIFVSLLKPENRDKICLLFAKSSACAVGFLSLEDAQIVS